MEIKNMKTEDFLKGGISEKVGEFFRHIGEGLNRPFLWLWKCFIFKKEYSYLTTNEQFELKDKRLKGFCRGRTFRKIGMLFYNIGRYVDRPFWWLWEYFTWKKEYEYLTEKEQQYLRNKCLRKALKDLKDSIKDRKLEADRDRFLPSQL